MNYALFAEWVREHTDELVQRFGVPRDEADHIFKYVEVASICAEAEERKESQFLLDFKRNGSTVLAERHNCTPQNIRKLRVRVLKSRTRKLRARLP